METFISLIKRITMLNELMRFIQQNRYMFFWWLYFGRVGALAQPFFCGQASAT